MTLSVTIRHRLGDFNLDVSLEAEGGVIAIFGPSGSGKTSIVNAIAGLIKPDQGRIAIDGVTMVDTGERIFLPPHKRCIGYVFQEDRLFPHLTVQQNLAYGRWFSRAPDQLDNLERIAHLLNIDDLLSRMPGKLSGGEKQRVAIGRALLMKPRLLLMDEPLSSLDEERKAGILPYIERLRDEIRIPIVYVSHSIAEITRLATTVALLSKGRLIATGPASEVMTRLDVFPFAGGADAGAIVEATVERHDERFGLTELSSRAGLWRLPRLDATAGQKLAMRVRARDVMLTREKPRELSALNVFPARLVEAGKPGPASIEVRLDCNGDILIAQMTRLSFEQLGFAPGADVYAIIKSVSFDPIGIGVVSA